MSDEEKKQTEEEPNFMKIIVGLVLAVVVLGGIVYVSYSATQKKANNKTYPAGIAQPISDAPGAKQGTTVATIDCSISEPNPTNIWAYYLKCDRFKTSSTTTWKTFANKDYKFEFSYPSDLETVEYPNGMGIIYKQLQPQDNLLYSMDIASSRSGEFKEMKGEAYVKSYWRQYSGLVALKSSEAFSNQFNVKGFKAAYLNFANESPNQEVFFESPENPGTFVHFASGVLDQSVYDKIIESFKWDSTAKKK